MRPELFTIEESHGKARLVGPRLSDLGTVPTDTEARHDRGERGRFLPGNKVAVGRTARTAIRAPYRAAEQRITDAVEGGAEPSDSDRLLADALAVFHAVRRELGSSSALVQGPAIAYAVETILAGYFTKAAADAGFLTDDGMRFHDRALACEQAASRAMTAALAATKALAGRRKPQRTALQVIDAVAQRELDDAADDDEPTEPPAPSA